MHRPNLNAIAIRGITLLDNRHFVWANKPRTERDGIRSKTEAVQKRTDKRRRLHSPSNAISFMQEPRNNVGSGVSRHTSDLQSCQG